MDQTQQTQGQGSQTNQTFVTGPFGGQIPTPPIADPGINTGTMPPFQFNANDFGDNGSIEPKEESSSNDTNTNETDPFAGGIQSLSIGSLPANSAETESNNLPTFESEDISQTEVKADPIMENNFSIADENNNTTGEIDFSLPNEESENKVETTANENNETENSDQIKDNITETPSYVSTENNISTTEGETKEETTSTVTNPTDNKVEEYQPQQNSDLIGIYNTFRTSLSELLNLKETKIANIVGHRTDTEEVKYEFEQKTETSITATRYHSTTNNNTTTQQTLEFNNTQGLKITLDSDIVYESGKEEDQDTVYYLKDKLNKFSTILNEEKIKEEKLIKDAKEAQEKKKRALEALRSF